MTEVTNATLFINRKRSFHCPVCGSKYCTEETLKVSIAPYAGDYCIACWAKWISENIPRLEETEP